jgi:hypothetical protein
MAVIKNIFVTHSGSISYCRALKPHHPVQKSTTEQIVQRENLSADRVKPDEVGKSKYTTGQDCTWCKFSNPEQNRYLKILMD